MLERPAYLLQMKWPSLLVVACSPRASHEERNERSSAPHEKTSSELRLRLQLRRVWKLPTAGSPDPEVSRRGDCLASWQTEMTPDTGRSGKALLHAQLLYRTSNYTAKSELNISTSKSFCGHYSILAV